MAHCRLSPVCYSKILSIFSLIKIKYIFILLFQKKIVLLHQLFIKNIYFKLLMYEI